MFSLVSLARDLWFGIFGLARWLGWLAGLAGLAGWAGPNEFLTLLPKVAWFFKKSRRFEHFWASGRPSGLPGSFREPFGWLGWLVWLAGWAAWLAGCVAGR